MVVRSVQLCWVACNSICPGFFIFSFFSFPKLRLCLVTEKYVKKKIGEKVKENKKKKKKVKSYILFLLMTILNNFFNSLI